MMGVSNVSRETQEKLNDYVALLKKWTTSINLIARTTVDTVWERHIVDSAQIYNLVPRSWNNWIDIGSGGGLPGVVIAILDAEARQITLVESDARKAQFLRTVKRELDLNILVKNERVEHLQPTKFDIVSARALAPLDRLINMAVPNLAQTGTAIFPKGKRFQEELDQAQVGWQFDVEIHPSQTDPDARILELSRIKQREP